MLAVRIPDGIRPSLNQELLARIADGRQITGCARKDQSKFDRSSHRSSGIQYPLFHGTIVNPSLRTVTASFPPGMVIISIGWGDPITTMPETDGVFARLKRF